MSDVDARDIADHPEDSLAGITAHTPRHEMRLDEAAAELTMQRLAARVVRQRCNQHQCAGAGCTDPHHRRDVDYLRHCLTMLDLPLTLPDVSDAEREAWRGMSSAVLTPVDISEFAE